MRATSCRALTHPYAARKRFNFLMKKIAYPLDLERYPLHGTVFSRARDFYLYAQDGMRFVDVELAGARALFGYRAGGTVTRMKQALDKGIMHEARTAWSARFERHVELLFPGRVFGGLFTYEFAQNEAVSTSGARENTPVLWRPFAGVLSDELLHGGAPLFALLPLAWGQPLCALLHFKERPKGAGPAAQNVETDGTDALSGARVRFAPARHVSPPVYAALCAALRDLLAHAAREGGAPKGDQNISFVARAVPAEYKHKKNIFFLAPQGQDTAAAAPPECLALPSGWRQIGIYIVRPAALPERHAREAFWRQGFIIPSSSCEPLALPYFFSAREMQRWSRAAEAASS